MKFRIDLEPLPCPRPRITTRGKFAHAYYPASYKKWKEAAAKKISQLWGDEILTGRLKVLACFFVKQPRTTKLEGPKPDIDNYQKSLFDAMTVAKVWQDDCQVARVYATKEWSAESAGYITLTIKRMPGPAPKVPVTRKKKS